MTSNGRTSFPALRCAMGDWVYYVTYLRFDDVRRWIGQSSDFHTSEKLREMIQREIGDRVDPIVDYLKGQKERFFNAIVVGVYGGSPQWYPIKVGKSPVLGTPDLDEDSRTSIGLLELNGKEDLFAIDGQHRVVAIKRALEQKKSLGNEELCAIFVPHSKDEDGLRRTRRLFSTLNRYAVPVSKGEIVALSEDDAFAIVTRQLVEDFPLLKSGLKEKDGFVAFRKTAPIPDPDQRHLMTVLTLYDITTSISIPFQEKKVRRQMEKLKHRRPSDRKLKSIYTEQKRFWKLLVAHIAEYDELFSSKPEAEVAAKYRSKEGGHLMFRPAGQQAFARSTRTMMDRGCSMEEAVSQLSQVPMELAEPPWRDVLWNPSTKRVNFKTGKLLIDSVLLHYVGQEPRVSGFKLLDEYRKTVGDPDAQLP